MTELECAISDKFHKAYAVFTGNGTTAMYLAFKTLQMQEKKILFPSISCTNPVNAAIFAGYEVGFCDINLNDYTVDLNELEGLLKTHQYGIVVPTHIYGHRYDENAMRELCTKYRVILFEDAAQSYCVSKSADLSVMSFGHTKVCDTPLGGGAILTDNVELAEKIAKERLELIDKNTLPDSLFDEYCARYYTVTKSGLSWEERNQRLRSLQIESKKYFIYDLQSNPVILDELAHLEDIVEMRRKKAQIYKDELCNKYVIHPKKADPFCWRYTFLYKGDREYLLERAREIGIDISSWYLSLPGIYKGEHKGNADKLERQVVNLWVDLSHTEEQIREEIALINKIMEEDHAR
ncbi:MAG: DegT/DnrJ/EryC1/StrS family aminotransferase [Lachnospiraceae bacterium]|nr:DegT/DnrJ/EryC1/StrS family aminotransferase [Lachnospiraceae bacterium]